MNVSACPIREERVISGDVDFFRGGACKLSLTPHDHLGILSLFRRKRGKKRMPRIIETENKRPRQHSTDNNNNNTHDDINFLPQYSVTEAGKLRMILPS